MLLLSAPIPTPQAGQPRFQARPRRGSSPSPCSTCSVAPGIGPLRDAVSQEFWPDIWQHVGPPWAKASPAAVPPISLGSQGHLGVSGLLRATRAHATLLRVGGLLVPQGECPGRQALSLRGFSHSSGSRKKDKMVLKVPSRCVWLWPLHCTGRREQMCCSAVQTAGSQASGPTDAY